MINSMGFVGSHAWAVPIDRLMIMRGKMIGMMVLDSQTTFFIQHLLLFGKLFNLPANILKRYNFDVPVKNALYHPPEGG
jgi:hypothetical protein